MTPRQLPAAPAPDYTRVVRTLRRDGPADYVPPLEFLADPEIVAAVLDEPAVPKEATLSDGRAMQHGIDQTIRFYHRLGYGVFRAKAILDLPLRTHKAADTADLKRAQRSWMSEGQGLIASWQDFERYPWPSSADADYSPLEYTCRHLPDGMAVLAKSYGVFEQAMFLMGYQTFALALHDQPDLVAAVFAKIEEIYLPFNRALTEIEGVIGLWMGDDLGFRSGTLVSPQHLRQYVFPIQRKVSRLCHDRGLLFLLHTCGDTSAVIGDLIDDVKIDAKHSFEDAIQSVEAFVGRHAGRVAAVGGVDVDLLARGSQEQVQARTRQILEACAPSRAYACGSGNSVTNYVPPANFLAMLDECHRFNRGG